MAAGDDVFTGSIPEIYNRYLVPLIFEPYAIDLAERVARRNVRNVLETAAGTGVLTRALASRLPTSARIVATDLNGPMLQIAEKTLVTAKNIEWKMADALALPFADGSFDAVVCQFGAMFFPDKVRAFVEAKRVLTPGGTFLFNVWDKISTNEFIDTVSATLKALFPNDPPRFMERTPHGYHDPSKIREDLSAAGFKKIAVETIQALSRSPSAREAAIGYCQGNPLRIEIESRKPGGLENTTQLAAEALEKKYGQGPIEGNIQALVLTASDD